MILKSGFVILCGIFLASLGLAAWAYPQLPETIATHWNIAGEADGFSDRGWGLIFGPLALLVILALYVIIPFLDPLRANLEKFGRAYSGLFIAIGSLLFYIYFLSIWHNLGHQFDFAVAIIPALSAFFFVIGATLRSAKRNWFVGIRTPWTMSSDVVWEKTHKVGATLFQVLAFLVLLCIFYPAAAFAVLIGGAVVVSLGLVLYSYVEYRKLQKVS